MREIARECLNYCVPAGAPRRCPLTYTLAWIKHGYYCHLAKEDLPA